MKIQISKNSPIPVATQLKERITIALSLGELRPGDTLPSIRDLEESLGIGRSIVRRVYLELSEQGILEMKHGRRVSVRDGILPAADTKQLTIDLNAIVREALNRARKLNVNDISFARYLLSKAVEETRSTNQLLFAEWHKPLAVERAGELSELWGVPITPVSFQDLGDLLASSGDCIRHIFTSYYRLEHVLEEVEQAKLSRSIQVIPLSVKFKPELIRRIESLPAGSKVCLFSEPKEFPLSGASYADVYRRAFPKSGLQFYVKEVTGEAEILRAVNSPRCALGLVNAFLWGKLSEKTRGFQKIARSVNEIDRDSLELARVRAGIFAMPG